MRRDPFASRRVASRWVVLARRAYAELDQGVFTRERVYDAFGLTARERDDADRMARMYGEALATAESEKEWFRRSLLSVKADLEERLVKELYGGAG